jgi:hypothetical protein
LEICWWARIYTMRTATTASRASRLSSRRCGRPSLTTARAAETRFSTRSRDCKRARARPVHAARHRHRGPGNRRDL